MEKVFGPFKGHFVVVRVTEASESSGSFSASYRICGDAAGGSAQAGTAFKQRVAGLSGSVDEAFDIALRLARLHVAGLRGRIAAAAAPDRKSTAAVAEFSRSWSKAQAHDSLPMAYQPTLPCPLLPMASGPG